jgi:hypothetical protein
MPLSPGVSELVTIGGAAAAPNTPDGKIFSTDSSVKSITLNPFGPLETGRTVTAGEGIALKKSSGSSISGSTTA